MSDYRYQIVKHNGIDCLHVMIEFAPNDIAHAYIPLDDIWKAANYYGEMNDSKLPRTIQNIQWIAFAARNQIAYWKRQVKDASCSQEAAFEQIDELCREYLKREEKKA